MVSKAVFLLDGVKAVENRQPPEIIEFNRPAKFKFVKELGAGSCGATVLLRDDDMDCFFVAKKYRPGFARSDAPEEFDELLNRFKLEARILFKLNHINIVRVFNYFDYKERNTAYILMEYIDGSNILDFSRENPSMIDVVFEGVIDGFAHLEEMGILHRDIRAGNIIVDRSGVPKVIDFGFGKKFQDADGIRNKSITLNWWCEKPPEFEEDVYDFQTEVYFIGKLFEEIISDIGASEFKYNKIIKSMCERERKRRSKNFSEIRSAISAGHFEEISFSFNETSAYRNFANSLCHIIVSIDQSTKLERDLGRILSGLQQIHNHSMLEEHVQNPEKLASVFLKTPFRYWSKRKFETETLHKFINTLKSMPADKQFILLENLLTRLDSLERTKPKPEMDGEIPF